MTVNDGIRTRSITIFYTFEISFVYIAYRIHRVEVYKNILPFDGMLENESEKVAQI